MSIGAEGRRSHLAVDAGPPVHVVAAVDGARVPSDAVSDDAILRMLETATLAEKSARRSLVIPRTTGSIGAITGDTLPHWVRHECNRQLLNLKGGSQLQFLIRKRPPSNDCPGLQTCCDRSAERAVSVFVDHSVRWRSRLGSSLRQAEDVGVLHVREEDVVAAAAAGHLAAALAGEIATLHSAHRSG